MPTAPRLQAQTHAVADKAGRPTKEFYNWLKQSVLLADSHATLTNKTITDPSNKLGGVTMAIGGDATGDIYFNNAGLLARLAIGTAGAILTVASGLPAWLVIGSNGQVLTVVGGLPVWAAIPTPTSLITAPVTVASLGSASPAGQHKMASDANATTFNSIVAGSGTNTVPVFSDGTNWRIG